MFSIIAKNEYRTGLESGAAPVGKPKIGLNKDFTDQYKIIAATWHSGGLTARLQLTDGDWEILVRLPQFATWECSRSNSSPRETKDKHYEG